MTEKGGKREGAGRKQAKHGKTITIRVPIACINSINKIVEAYKNKVNTK